MCERFRLLQQDIRVARGSDTFKINLAGNRVNAVGLSGRPTRAARAGTVVSQRQVESSDDSDDLDAPLT
jgi:hypothetical protein